MSTRTATKTSDTSSAGGPPHSSPKYDAKPAASDPLAAKLAERNDTVTRKVSALLSKAFWTYSEEPGGLRVLGHQLGVRRSGDRRDRDAGGEGDPERPTDRRGDEADQDVDPRPEDVPEGVEEELHPGDGPLEAAVVVARRCGRVLVTVESATGGPHFPSGVVDCPDPTGTRGPLSIPRVGAHRRRRSDAHRVSSWRLESWSLRSVEDMWVSTVLTEMKSSRATSL